MKQLQQIDRQRAFETSRTVFGIMGAAGYAGYLAAMHFLMAGLSIAMLGATWYAVYSITEVK